ncbi:MAG: DUF4493 domain-containing protein [Muribaculaceae bacterium]|nr:DUF4493 domain-containing protein [Muribaculaceae bacterium]
MKLKYQAALLTAALSLGACSSDELIVGGGSSATGSVAKPGVEVSNVENVVKEAGSRATYDVSNYIVDFYAVGQDAPYVSYKYSQMPGTVELPVGSYAAKVRSHNVEKAGWDCPYFAGTSAPFAIAADEITEVQPVKCVFSSLKVSVVFGPNLRKVLGDDVEVTVVANDEGSLVYTPSETRGGYFEALEGSVTIAATFEGTVDGQHLSLYKALADAAKGQHRIITYELGGTLPDPGEPTGSVDPDGIKIDMTYEDVDLSGAVDPGKEDTIGDDDDPGKLPEIPGDGDEPTPPAPPTPGDEDAIEFGGTLSNGQTFTTTQLSEYTVVVKAQSGIADMLVQIISTDGLTPEELTNVGLTDKFSLVNDEQYFEGLSGLGFPVGDEVRNQTELTLNITEFMPLLQVLGPNTAKFIMTVTDNAGNSLLLEFTIVNP